MTSLSAFKRFSASSNSKSSIHRRTGIVVAQRPSRFYARALQDDGRQTQVWFDGKSLEFAGADAQLWVQDGGNVDTVVPRTMAAPTTATPP